MTLTVTQGSWAGPTSTLWVQLGSLQAGQLGACSLVAAELEEAPKNGNEGSGEAGGLLVLTQLPGLPLPLRCSRVDSEGPRWEGRVSLGLML